MKIQYRNYFNATFGIFNIVETCHRQILQERLDALEEENRGAKVNIKTFSNRGNTPSEYLVLKDGVYRLSDHWNHVGNCLWLLNASDGAWRSEKTLCLAYCAYKDMQETLHVFGKLLNGSYDNPRLATIICNTVSSRQEQPA